MQKTPNQKGFTKKVKRVCSFKGFNQKREKRKEKYTLDDKDHDYAEMDRDEAEEKCLMQQQVIMDQMKQLKKLDADIENHNEYYADKIDQEAKRLEEIIWLAERIINIQILHNKAEEEIKSKSAKIHNLKTSRTRTMSEPVSKVKRSRSINCESGVNSTFSSRSSVRRKQWFNSLYTPRRIQSTTESINTQNRPFSLAMVGYDTTSDSRLCRSRIDKTCQSKLTDKLSISASAIKRSSSDIALTAKKGKQLNFPSRTEPRKGPVPICDTDSDTGIRQRGA